MLLMIDNYDSFTYNIVQYFGELGAAVEVYRNDEITLEGIAQRSPSLLVISPGPCAPEQAGISVAAIHHFMGRLPILGVCLGHQSITEVFGGKVVRNTRVMHGKTSAIEHDQQGVFAGLPSPLEVGRYHSLVAQPASMPPELIVTAQTAQGEIMGLRHRDLMIEGVQFHPESVLTPQGPALLANFLGLRGGRRS